jgi:antitoxin component YwqK of YwqJK toxin-antitoxin module
MEPAESRVVTVASAPVPPPDGGVAGVAPPVAPPPHPPLACEPGTQVVAAPAPEPTFYCAKPDGTRQGAFHTLFPDASVQIEGTYQRGKLDGAWIRHYPGGAIAETGTYNAGLADGVWRQLSPEGTVLGQYTLKKGTGTKKRWYDDGPLYSERQLRYGVLFGAQKIYEHDGNVVIAAKILAGKFDEEHVVGLKNTLRIEETFKKGTRIGPRKIWQWWNLLLDESYDDKGKLDGAFTIWRDKKIPRVQGTYEHGNRVGTWTWFDNKNQKEREGDYTDGKKTGPWTEWTDNTMTFQGVFTDGKPDGEFITYDKTGAELGRFEIHDGTGVMVTFHPNKKPATRTTMSKGLMAGLYEELTPRGKQVVEGHYLDDKKHGWWREKTELGVPTLEQHWKYGKLDGTVRKFIDGKVAVESTYKMGKAEGPYSEYRGSKPSLTGQFKGGVRTGTWTSYGPGGEVVMIATYKAGVLDGPWKVLDSGELTEGTMVAGRRAGTWTTTTRSGQKTTVTYGPSGA